MGAHGSHVHPAPDVTIDYFTAGDGAPVVLVHGITESRRTWDPFIAPLIDRGHRLIAVDLRGHGDSSKAAPYDLTTMAGDLAAVIAAERADDALLIGHSLGGAVVSAYAAGGPCRGVINVDQPLLLAGFQAALAPLEARLRGDASEFRSAMNAVFDQMAGALSGHERRRVERIRDPDQDVVLGIWDLVLSSSAAELDAVVAAVVESIRVPYLSLHGIDPGEDYGAWLTGKIDGAMFEVWPGLGHYPHLVAPDRFIDRIEELGRSISG
jgi:pimeloyl-ACP methyl ester carboxylesterase